FGQRFRPEVSLGRIALVILVPGVPPAPIRLRQDERRAVARHVAHAGGRPAAPTVHAFGVLAAGHLQAVARARKLHFLHGARRAATDVPAPPTTTPSLGASTFAPTATIRPSSNRIEPLRISCPVAVMIVALRIRTGGLGCRT